MMRWCLSLSASCCRWRSDVSSDRAAKFPARSDTKRRSSEQGSRYFPGCTGQGYRVCGAVVRGFVPAAVRRYLWPRCCPVVRWSLPMSASFPAAGFYRVLCGGRTITANKEAGFVEFWRGGRSHLPCSPCCSGRYPVALALLRLYRWTYRDRYAAGNRFCSSAGLCPVSFLP